MITYLHHTDPELPHYRQPQWNFQRGAAATVDRDFLGWMGRFFLHDVAHYHVVHHFFPKMPFCQSPSFFFTFAFLPPPSRLVTLLARIPRRASRHRLMRTLGSVPYRPHAPSL